MRTSQAKQHSAEQTPPMTERSAGQREPERSSVIQQATPVTPIGAAQGTKSLPNPEVDPPKPRRRQFTAEYKRRILDEASRCTGEGEIGKLLRREGLYSSLLTDWRRQLELATATALAPKKRGRKVRPEDELLRRNAQLEKENKRLEERLHQAEIIIEVQKKLSQILGIPLKTPETEGFDS